MGYINTNPGESSIVRVNNLDRQKLQDYILKQ